MENKVINMEEETMEVVEVKEGKLKKVFNKKNLKDALFVIGGITIGSAIGYKIGTSKTTTIINGAFDDINDVAKTVVEAID